MDSIEPTREELSNLVTQYVPAITGSADIAAVVGYISPDYENIYYQGTLQNEAGDPLALGDTTLFELGSVTKTFTATLYEFFVQSGSVSKDAKLGDFYSPSGAAANPDAAYMPQGTAIGSNYVDITLKSLANYTSGLPDTGIPVDSGTHYGISEMFQYLSGNPFELGKKGEYLYSNLGFALLAQAVATSQSQDFHTLLHQNILFALNTDHTVMVRLLGSRLSGLPMGYDAQTGSPNPVTVAGATGFPAMGGAGALVSTPKDMMRWLRWNMGLESGNALNDLLAALQDPSTHTETKDGSKLGLSWFITKHAPPNSHAYDLVWKDGSIPGFSSNICLSRSEKPGKIPSEYGCFVMTNSQNNGPNALGNLSAELMAIMRRKADMA